MKYKIEMKNGYCRKKSNVNFLHPKYKHVHIDYFIFVLEIVKYFYNI